MGNKAAIKKDNRKKRFEIGDLAVYPAHGVGKIESVESRVINGTTHEFYIMKIIENGMIIMVPTANIESVGLRELVNEEEIAKIFDVLRQKKDDSTDTQTWNRRYKEYMDKIKTGSLYDVASVFRDLYLLKSTKELSFGERKLLDTAQSLLLKEISMARRQDEKTVMKEIIAVLES